MFTPLRDDVVVEFESNDNYEGSIQLLDKTPDTVQYFRVLAAGPDAKITKVGDKIYMPWAKITPPFFHEGKKLGVTSEKEIWAIVDEE